MLYDPSGTATCLHHPSGSGALGLPAAGRERLARSAWLALTAGPAGMTEALLDGRSPQTRVAWDVKADPNHYPMGLRRRLLREADLLCFNRDEIAFLCESLVGGAGGSQEEQLRRLRAATDATLVLTDGPAGCRLIQSNGTAAIPAAPIDVEDPTGVGDTFFAAFLSATMRGQPPLEAAEFATSQAADYLHHRERSA
jgi:2-dehydro-3-deoxygluconokinase